MVNGRKWYLQGGIFFKATGCSLDWLQLVFFQFLIFENETATGPKSDWLVWSSFGIFLHVIVITVRVVVVGEWIRATAHYHFHVVVRARTRAKVMVRTRHCCCQKDEGRDVSSSGREWVQEGWWQGHIVIVERKRARACCCCWREGAVTYHTCTCTGYPNLCSCHHHYRCCHFIVIPRWGSGGSGDGCMSEDGSDINKNTMSSFSQSEENWVCSHDLPYIDPTWVKWLREK